jgi:hypothetical protein
MILGSPPKMKMSAAQCKLRTAGRSVEIVADWSLESVTESDPDGFGIAHCRLPIRMSTQGNLAPICHPSLFRPEQEIEMTVVNPRCGGLDIHKKRVSACRIWQREDGQVQVEQSSFGT